MTITSAEASGETLTLVTREIKSEVAIDSGVRRQLGFFGLSEQLSQAGERRHIIVVQDPKTRFIHAAALSFGFDFGQNLQVHLRALIESDKIAQEPDYKIEALNALYFDMRHWLVASKNKTRADLLIAGVVADVPTPNNPFSLSEPLSGVIPQLHTDMHSGLFRKAADGPEEVRQLGITPVPLQKVA